MSWAFPGSRSRSASRGERPWAATWPGWRVCRRVVGDGVEVYVDANGGYTAKQAVRVGRRLEDDSGVIWFEEPVSSDDLAGLRHVREQVGLDVAAGEYGYDETYFDRMVGAEAVDCVQADVTRCGGYTSWLRIAAIAAAHGLQISGHCAPQLHSHVAARCAQPAPCRVLPRSQPARRTVVRRRIAPRQAVVSPLTSIGWATAWPCAGPMRRRFRSPEDERRG